MSINGRRGPPMSQAHPVAPPRGFIRDPPSPSVVPAMSVAGGRSTQFPAWQACPGGHTAPMQLSTQAPPTQWVPGPQVTMPQPVSTHWPLIAQVLAAPHGRQSHDGTQAPPWHT